MSKHIPFVNLHNHTEYSLLDGMITADELIDFAVENNQPGIAMTDHGVMGGFFQIHSKAREAGIKPLLGCEFYLVEDIDFQQNREKGEKEKRFHFTAIAKNLKGLKNLFKLSTKGHLEGFYYRPRVNMNWIKKHSEGVIWLSGCMAGPLGQIILDRQINLAYEQAEKFKEYFGEDFYIEIQPTKIEDQVKINPQLVRIANQLDIPLVATADAHYLKEQANSHPVFLGINSGGNMWSFGDDNFYLMTGREMYNLMKENHPKLSEKDVIKSIENTMKVFNKVENFELEKHHNVIPKPYPKLETKEDEYEFLLELCDKGWKMKGMEDKKDLPEYQNRLEKELKSIQNLGFVRYFLMVYDLFHNFIIPEKIMYGPGRGSSAGSLISCLLDITNPDPIEKNLIFERFISPNRVTLPDIDMDFEDERRDEIKQYLIQKYGKGNACSIGTYGTLKGRQVLRDVCRVFDNHDDYPDISRKEVDNLSQFIIQRSGGDARVSNTVIDTFEEFEEAQKFNKKYPYIKPHCQALEGKKRQAGIHAAGVVISPVPLTDVMPLERRKGVTVSALDGREIDKLGILKLDVLGLNTLAIIKDAIEQIGMERKDLINVDYNDPKVLEKFGKGDTAGVFQFSSVGMSDTLKDMPIKSFEDLVSINSLYRPGGMRSGMCRDFIERRKGADFEKVNPIYDNITEPTFGLIVYQEQVMRIFAEMADYEAHDVDSMRKKIAKSHGVEELGAQRDTFVNGCIDNGIDKELADEIFTMMVHFGSYGFNRSHAVVYTQIAYWTQWLKTYYPLYFYVASVNNKSDDDKVRRLLGQLERESYELLFPHINKSKTKFTVEEIDGEQKIRCGLRYIKGIGEKTCQEIMKHQPYKDDEDIATREGIYRRVFHRGIRKLLKEVGAWTDWETQPEEDREKHRERLAAEELFPFPVLDKAIKETKALANNYDCDFVNVNKLNFEKSGDVYIRGVFSGANYARIGDFGKPSPYSRWEIGQRYVMMDFEDGTGHIRIKFNPDKYEEYKGQLRIGKRVLIHGRIIKDIKMIFIDFMIELTEEKVKKHKEKYS